METRVSGSRRRLPISLVVVSCDAYSDMWPAFCAALMRYWPDCPFPSFLVTNEKTAPNGFSTLSVGTDTSWSSNLQRALLSVRSEYVLLCTEDLLLTETVSTAEIVETVELAIEQRLDTLQLVNFEWIWSRRGQAQSRYSAVPLGATYRASTVFTIWRSETLLKLLRPGENAWQFEYFGSDRLAPEAKVYLSCRSHFQYENAVVKGKLVPKAVHLCSANQYPLVTKRPVLSTRDMLALGLIRLRASALRLVPMRYRKAAKDFVTRLAERLQETVGMTIR